MAIAGEIQGQENLSDEQEQEIANMILKRAELAQMTRQLKVNLSKVPSPNVSHDSNCKVTRKRKSKTGGDREIEEAISKVSPKKNRVKNDADIKDKGNQDDIHLSPVKAYRRPGTPPPGPPASSSSSLRSDGDLLGKSEDIPTTPKPNKSQNIPPVIVSGVTSVKDKDNKHAHLDHGMKQVMRTPRRLSNHTRTGSENDVAVDLLMYLATSPYTSSSSLRGSRHGAHEMSHIPTTPMAYGNGNAGSDDEDEAIRFSHLKPSISSPQSTFKVPMHVVHNSIPSSASHSELLMESPSLYMVAASPSPQKRIYVNLSSHESHSNSASSGLLPHVPSTPSRELRTSASHLLRTPNFNMGDYVHNLFSPSPRGNTITSAGNASSTSQNNPAESTGTNK